MAGKKLMHHVFVQVIILCASSIISAMAADREAMTECESRCQPLAGEERYRCIKTCLGSKRRSVPENDTRKRSTYKECEASCSSLKGLDQIRCIRACMESARTEPPARKDTKPDTPPSVSACESRCSVLTRDLKEKCMARCKKEKYGEFRDPLRFNK